MAKKYKKVLSDEGFTNALIKRFTSGDGGNSCDHIMRAIIRKNETEIAAHIKGCVSHYVDTYENCIECIGPTLHGGFRKWDVMDNPQYDIIMWHALNEAKQFWKDLEIVCAVHDGKLSSSALEG